MKQRKSRLDWALIQETRNKDASVWIKLFKKQETWKVQAGFDFFCEKQETEQVKVGFAV